MRIDFLKSRRFVEEDMDNFSLQGKELKVTISELSTVNKYLGNTNVILNVLKPLIQHNNKPLRIVDLGCGGADILRAIANYSAKIGKEVHLTGIDGNSNIIELAKVNTQVSPAINFIASDILHPNFVLPGCDILISTHFMYHFTDQELISFLRKNANSIHHKIIFSELQRSVISYRGFQLLGFILGFSKMILSDGLKAISRSFRKKELLDIFDEARVGKCVIHWKWAFRYLVELQIEDHGVS